jgi:hypothetical protein
LRASHSTFNGALSIRIAPLNQMRYFVVEVTREDFKGILKRVPVKRKQLEQLAAYFCIAGKSTGGRL